MDVTSSSENVTSPKKSKNYLRVSEPLNLERKYFLEKYFFGLVTF